MSDQPMTPDEAREELATGAYDWWSTCRHALETIAGMTEEWGVAYTGVNHGRRHIEWCPPEHSEPDSESQARQNYRMFKNRRMNPTLVRHYVTEAVGDE